SAANPRNCPRWLATQIESAAYSAKAAGASFGSALIGWRSVAMKSTGAPASAATAPTRARCRRVVSGPPPPPGVAFRREGEGEGEVDRPRLGVVVIRRGLGEAERAVESPRFLHRCEGVEIHPPVAGRSSTPDQLRRQRSTDALAAERWSDVEAFHLAVSGSEG